MSSDRKKITTPRMTSVLYPDRAAVSFPHKVVGDGGRTSRASRVFACRLRSRTRVNIQRERTTLTPSVAAYGSSTSVRRLKGEDGAGGDEDDDAGDDDRAELDAERDRERAGNVGDAIKGWDKDDEVEEAPADPRGRGQHMEPKHDGEEYVGEVQCGAPFLPCRVLRCGQDFLDELVELFFVEGAGPLADDRVVGVEEDGGREGLDVVFLDDGAGGVGADGVGEAKLLDELLALFLGVEAKLLDGDEGDLVLV